MNDKTSQEPTLVLGGTGKTGRRVVERLTARGLPVRIVRDDFAAPWVAWNIVRALASTAAFGCLAWALVLRGRIPGRASAA